ncbi:MAG: hypothetical protein HRU26_04130 [Psychroserpens sp.]|nr:hypothetical protein [Psychroserpens sp.]
MSLKYLKTISLISFLIIARSTPHVIIPLIVGLPFSALAIFDGVIEAILPILSLCGLLMVFYDIIVDRNRITVIDYLLSYIILGVILKSIIDKNDIQHNYYYIVTSSVYIVLSLFIIYKILKKSHK